MKILPRSIGLRARLVAVITGALAVVVALLTAWVDIREHDLMDRSIVSKATSYGTMTAGQLRSAVAFADRETARDVIEPIVADPDIASVVVFGQGGEPLYTYGAPSAWVERASAGVIEARQFEIGDRVAVVMPIQSLEGPRGTLVVEISTARVAAEQRRLVIEIVLGASVALGLGAMLATAIADGLTRRIQAISDLAEQLAGSDRPVTLHVTDPGRDELGELVATFEHMSREVVRSREELEQRVEERTIELQAANACLEAQMERRSQIEMELRESQKLKAIGTLAAGLAHEMNTPLQFVSDALRFVDDASTDLGAAIGGLRRIASSVDPPEERARAAEQIVDQHDVVYIEDKTPAALARAREGLQRLADLVRALKSFAQPDGATSYTDLGESVRSTVTVASTHIGRVAVVHLDLADLPAVRCSAGELNQTLLAILLNAAQAIDDAQRGEGHIAIRTRAEGQFAVVEIEDDGVGILEQHRPRIFEPFFTTRAVGSGSGQGLAAARAVVARHQGRIEFHSVVGVGTTFRISLPIDESVQGGVRAA